LATLNKQCLLINEERKEYVTFTDSYYEASQKLVVPSTETAFDACADADAVVVIE
jgi:polar amino acid transport system substrate-binding protein